MNRVIIRHRLEDLSERVELLRSDFEKLQGLSRRLGDIASDLEWLKAKLKAEDDSGFDCVTPSVTWDELSDAIAHSGLSVSEFARSLGVGTLTMAMVKLGRPIAVSCDRKLQKAVQTYQGWMVER